MDAQQFIEGATVTPLGEAWGEPLWRFDNEAANLSVDVHAPDEDAARAAALEAVVPLLEASA